MASICAESPLARRTQALRAQCVPGLLHIAEVPFAAQVNVRVDPKNPAAERIGTALGTTLPNQPNEVLRAGEFATLWLGPDEWLVLGPEGAGGRIEDTVHTAAEGEPVSVVDVSANRTTLSVSGSAARELLNKGCALDLHPHVFESSRCAQTMLGRAGIVLVCWDAARASFWVLVRSSYARYLADWLVDAAAEYGR